MSKKIIELKNVNKWFDKFQALKDVNLRSKSTRKNCNLWSIRFWKINFD